MRWNITGWSSSGVDVTDQDGEEVGVVREDYSALAASAPHLLELLARITIAGEHDRETWAEAVELARKLGGPIGPVRGKVDSCC